MFSVGPKFRTAVAALSLATLGLVGQSALAQFGVGDIVVGLSGAGGNTFRVYDASENSWSNGPAWQVNEANAAFIQSVEFDNANGLSHNARGNLLGVNFGNSFTGFEVFNFATDGTTNASSVWSIVEATGGIRGQNPPTGLSIRGGGLSVSPDNTKIAWAANDAMTGEGGGAIWVHDYSAGTSIGMGVGATMTGPRRTGLGNTTGGPGTSAALRTGSTQGTTWLNNSTVICFNGFGELITLDVSGQAPGTEDGTLAGFQPTIMTNWRVANSEVSFTGQTTDIEYNPAVDPNHIYAAVTKVGSFEAELFAYNYSPGTGAISLAKRMVVPGVAASAGGDPPIREPREIALGSDGALYYSGFTAGTDLNLVMKFPNVTDIDNWAPENVAVFFTGGPSNFNGMDVAFSAPAVEALLGDYNENDILDAADYTVWRDAFEVGGTIPNDPTGGVATEADYDYWKANFGSALGAGAVAGAAVPEPTSTFTLAATLVASLLVGRRRSAA